MRFFLHLISLSLQRTWYAPSLSSVPRPFLNLLALAAKLYEQGLRHHQRQARERRHGLPVYVISVGNLVAGGTGKTPLTLWLAQHLSTQGFRPAILSRGYQRKDDRTVRVPAAGAGYREAWQYGDEPVLMAHRAKPVPVWVGKDRWRSGNLAIQAGAADTLILDDGFQHLALDRSLDIVLLDAQNPFGNGALLPLGPLREPPAHLERADAIVLTRAEPTAESAKTRSRITSLFPGKPVFSCIHRLAGLRREIDGDCLPLTALEGNKAVAFAGIARPESFFQHLRQAGVVLSGTFAFPDHYRYLRDDMVMLVKAMRESEARFLLSTEKDFFRIPPEFQAFTLATVVEMDFLLDHEAFCGFLRERLPSR